MLKSLMLFSAILYLVEAEILTKVSGNDLILSDGGYIETVRDYILGNKIIISDTGSNQTGLNHGTNPDSSYIRVYNDERENKVVSIVVSPIIHNVGQDYGGGFKSVEITTHGPVTTPAPPPPPPPVISVVSGTIKLIVRYIIQGFAGGIRAVVRFIICTFLPICGLFSIFGDEEVDESLVTPDVVTRGLDFIEGIIEKYHYFQNAS